ncbi:tryptophan synthase subunit alpha [Streptomyces sp. NBC_00659]|uniref:tryptophan synthase subunit alpha n=1 Tax=Streptomyces sp. NBC_00659 TaxID=2903669 RepID=UPI002E2F1154|nr:tryptophan synthase subunit alpha [Streptomyces sp. NBC_00659]
MPERLLPTVPVSGLAPDAVPGVASLSLASCRSAGSAAPVGPSPERPGERRPACGPDGDGRPAGEGRGARGRVPGDAHPHAPADTGEFFARRRPGRPGLAVFVNAGDPPLDILADLAAMLDDSDVDCLELAVPFPGSVTDGPVVRRSADRALASGVTLDAVLDAVTAIRPTLRRLRIALLADWSHTVRGRDPGGFARALADAGCDGLLLHGLPPRLRAAHYEAAQLAGLPLVTTCYAVSGRATVAEAAQHASAYLYLVAHYGRSGTTAAPDHDRLAAALAEVRAATRVPVAVGFGVRTRADIAALEKLGADAAVVGSAGVARIEQALAERRDPVREFASFVAGLRGPAAHHRHHRTTGGSHT